MSNLYDISYPTVRAKLDRLIKKIKVPSKEDDVEFVNMIKGFVIDERISLDATKIIIEKYKKERAI